MLLYTSRYILTRNTTGTRLRTAQGPLPSPALRDAITYYSTVYGASLNMWCAYVPPTTMYAHAHTELRINMFRYEFKHMWSPTV